MFNSTKEFDQAMHAILLNLKAGKSDLFDGLDLDESDAIDALERAIDIGLVIGLKVSSGLGGHVTISKNNPRLSYDGLAFIESFKQA